MFRKVVLRVLEVLGLRKPARAVKEYLRANGLGDWEPLVPETAFEECVRGALESLPRSAIASGIWDYLEFGVSRGTSMACVHRVLRQSGFHNVRLIGFDSFEGMPEEAAEQGWAPGSFRSTQAATRSYLENQGVDMKRVNLVKGWFRDTLTLQTRERLGYLEPRLIMVDCDIHSATLEVLDFCAPLIPDHAIIIFDDWGWMSDRGALGQKEAFEAFLAKYPDIEAEALPAYIPQARIFRLRRSSVYS